MLWRRSATKQRGIQSVVGSKAAALRLMDAKDRILLFSPLKRSVVGYASFPPITLVSFYKRLGDWWKAYALQQPLILFGAGDVWVVGVPFEKHVAVE